MCSHVLPGDTVISKGSTKGAKSWNRLEPTSAMETRCLAALSRMLSVQVWRSSVHFAMQPRGPCDPILTGWLHAVGCGRLQVSTSDEVAVLLVSPCDKEEGRRRGHALGASGKTQDGVKQHPGTPPFAAKKR